MIYEHVRAAIDASGIKRMYIAEKIDMPESTFSALMNGKRTMKAEELLAICEVLGKGMDEVANYPIRQAT